MAGECQPGEGVEGMSNLWFTKEQIEAEENAGKFNAPWDERAFRSRILQDWLTLHGEVERLKATLDVAPHPGSVD